MTENKPVGLSDGDWPHADENEDGTLREVLTMDFNVAHYPRDGRITVDLATVSSPSDHDSALVVSETLSNFIEDRFDVFLGDFSMIADPENLQPRVTEHNYTTPEFKSDTEWDLSNEYRSVSIDWPTVGDEFVVQYNGQDEEIPDEVKGTVIDVTPRTTEDDLKYWDLTLETGYNGTVELSTEREGTPVIHEHADGTRRELGTLISITSKEQADVGSD